MKKEYKIGLVGIVALVALFLGINFLKGRALFNTNKEYYVRFANAKGLAKSSQVYVEGFQVGIVSDIIYDYTNPGNVLVEMSVDPRLVLRQGSSVTIESSLMGGTTLSIVPTKNKGKVYAEGDTISGSEFSGLMGQAAGMIPQVNDIINKVDTLISSLNRLTNDPRLPLILANMEKVTSDLTVTTKYLNSVVGTELPQIMHTYNKVGENMQVITENFKGVDLNPTIASVNNTIANVNSMVEQMRSPNGTLGALISDRSLYNSLNNTVNSMDSLMIDIKSHPKRYVHFSVFGRKDK